MPESCFHTFEGDSGMIGISFAEGSEATDFASAVRFRLGKMSRAASVRGAAPPRPSQATKRSGNKATVLKRLLSGKAVNMASSSF